MVLVLTGPGGDGGIMVMVFSYPQSGIVFDLFYRVHYDIDFGRRKEKFLKEIHVFFFSFFGKKIIFGSSLPHPFGRRVSELHT